jgi:hypothetical protein
MHPASITNPVRRADPVELLLGRPPLTWADYVEAGGYEFDAHFIDTAGRVSPFAPGDRRKYAVNFAEMECPKAVRLAAVAAARGNGC